MARTVNEQEHTRKRDEILDAAMRLILAKGYERMTIQDILANLKISSGAFYHYFDSKPALLEAFIDRIRQLSGNPLLPIVHDPGLSAIEKLQGFFDTLDRLRMANQAQVIEMGRVWYTDQNAIVRQKVDEAIVRQRAPLLSAIVCQGIREGVFTTTHPTQTGEIILSLLRAMGDTHARLLLSGGKESEEQFNIEEVVVVHHAYMEAIERVLGAPPNSLYRVAPETVKVWVGALGED